MPNAVVRTIALCVPPQPRPRLVVRLRAVRQRRRLDRQRRKVAVRLAPGYFFRPLGRTGRALTPEQAGDRGTLVASAKRRWRWRRWFRRCLGGRQRWLRRQHERRCRRELGQDHRRRRSRNRQHGRLGQHVRPGPGRDLHQHRPALGPQWFRNVAPLRRLRRNLEFGEAIALENA